LAAAGSDAAAVASPHGRPTPRPRYDPTSGETTMRLPVVPAQPGAPDEPVPPAPEPPPVPAVEARPEPIDLFTPAVPPESLPDPTAPRPPDPLAADLDELEATPIFAEVT